MKSKHIWGKREVETTDYFSYKADKQKPTFTRVCKKCGMSELYFDYAKKRCDECVK